MHSCPNTVAVVGLEYRAKSWDMNGILNMSVSLRLKVSRTEMGISSETIGVVGKTCSKTG